MARRKFNPDVPFQPISGASRITGFSTGGIRKRCKDGTIPCIRVGKDYRINMPLWLEQLNQQSMKEGGFDE